MSTSLDSPFVFASPSSHVCSTPTQRTRRRHCSTPPSAPSHQTRAAPIPFPFSFSPTASKQLSSTYSNIPTTPVRRPLSSSQKRVRQLSSRSSPAVSATKRARTRAPQSPSPSTSAVFKNLSPRSPPPRPVPSSSPLLFESRYNIPPVVFEALSDMSFLTPQQPNYLAADVEICLANRGVINMFGVTMTASNYTLSGNIVLDLPSLPTGLETRVREIKELVIRLEGRSDFHKAQGVFNPLLIHEDFHEVASPDKPIPVPIQDQERTRSGRIHTAVPFDMLIPGWLPPSHDTTFANVSYGVKVEARIGWATSTPSLTGKSNPRKALGANTSLNPLTVRASMSDFTEFTVLRHRVPVSIEGRQSDLVKRSYRMSPAVESSCPLDCMVTVPEWVDINGGRSALRVTVKFRLRQGLNPELTQNASPHSEMLGEETSVLTSRGEMGETSSIPMEQQRTSCGTGSNSIGDPAGQLPGTPATDAAEQSKTKPPTLLLKQLGMEVEETEHFSSHPYPSFTSTFPIPDEQPSISSGGWPFLSPRPPYATEDLLASAQNQTQWRGLRRRRCLLSVQGSQRNFVFDNEGLVLSDEWKTINALLPIVDNGDDPRKSGGSPQAEMDGIYYRIRHALMIQVLIRDPSSDKRPDRMIRLTAPIRFGTSPMTLPDQESSGLLPAYCQVYHENGDLRQCDPLPLYTQGPSNVSVNQEGPTCPAPTYQSLFPESLSAALTRSTTPPHREGRIHPAIWGSCPNGGTELDAGSATRRLKTLSRRTAHNFLTRMFA